MVIESLLTSYPRIIHAELFDAEVSKILTDKVNEQMRELELPGLKVSIQDAIKKKMEEISETAAEEILEEGPGGLLKNV